VGSEPLAKDRFGFATFVTWCPGRVDVGGVDSGQAALQQRIQQAEALLLINGPAKDVTAKNQRRSKCYVIGSLSTPGPANVTTSQL